MTRQTMDEIRSSREHSKTSSWACSLALHALLILYLTSWVPDQSRRGIGDTIRRGQVVLAWPTESSEKLEYLDESSTATREQIADDPAWLLDSVPPGHTLADGQLQPDPPITPPAETGWSLPDAGALSQPHDNKGRAAVAELTEADLEAIRAEQRRLAAMAPAGPPATIGMFGSHSITGRRFVFVIDRSKSMGAQGLGILGKARGELTTALRALEPHHQFQVVAFHHQTVMMNRREMLPATSETVGQVADFIDQLAPYGGTNYEGAIYTALALRPDAIILFTDGDDPGLNEGQIAAIERACGGGVHIHCLQFGWEVTGPSRSFLRQLAEKTGGSYRYVCVPEWEKVQERK